MDNLSEPNQNNSFSKTEAPLAGTTRPSCPIRGTQEKIEALKRAVFNLKLERFLLQEELKKTTGRQYYHGNENLKQSLKEHQQKYDHLLRELECKSEALADAMTTIEYQKKLEVLLKEKHAVEVHKYKTAVVLLENKLKQKDDNLRLFRLKKQKKLIRKMKERSLTGASRECAEIIAFKGRAVTTRFSAYRKNLFRIKLISMATATSASATHPVNFAGKLQAELKDEKLEAKPDQQDHNIISNKLLLMILKWIVMRHSIKHERDFHLDVIFTKDTLKNMSSIEVVGTTESPTADEDLVKPKPTTTAQQTAPAEAYICDKKAYESYEPSPVIHETPELKLSPVHLIKLIFMPFGCPFRQ